MVTVQSVFFSYLFLHITRRWDYAPAQAACLLHHRRVVIVATIWVWSHWPARQELKLPAHERCATQRHKVDLAGTARAHRGEEDLMKKDRTKYDQ